MESVVLTAADQLEFHTPTYLIHIWPNCYICKVCGQSDNQCLTLVHVYIQHCVAKFQLNNVILWLSYYHELQSCEC